MLWFRCPATSCVSFCLGTQWRMWEWEWRGSALRQLPTGAIPVPPFTWASVKPDTTCYSSCLDIRQEKCLTPSFLLMKPVSHVSWVDPAVSSTQYSPDYTLICYCFLPHRCFLVLKAVMPLSLLVDWFLLWKWWKSKHILVSGWWW